MAAVNNSDSELNLISLTVHSQADICRYMYTYFLPPKKEKPRLQSSFFKVSAKENEVPTEKNSSRASIFATKASYISN